MISALQKLWKAARRRRAARRSLPATLRGLRLEPLETRLAMAALVEIKATVTNLAGAAISSINAGSDFLVKVTAKDLRPTTSGVFGAWVDMQYDPDHASVAGPVVFGPRSVNHQSGDLATPGLVDEAGAFDNISSSAPAEKLLFSLQFTARGSGLTQFALDPADLLPFNDTLLFGSNTAVTPSQINYLGTSLNVIGNSPQLTIPGISASEGQAASLVGTLVDPHSAASHSITVNWNDWNNAGSDQFNLPATTQLSVNQVFNAVSGNATLKITQVNSATGTVVFTVGHTFANDGRPGIDTAASDIANAQITVDSNFQDGVWSSLASLGSAVTGAANGVISGSLYLAGGRAADGAVSNALVAYNPSTQGTTTLAAMPTARFGAASAVLNGKLYVVGGYTSSDHSQTTNLLEIYDPATNQWSTGPAAALSRGGVSAAVADGKLYLLGGLGTLTGDSGATLEVFDPALNQWSLAAPAASRRVDGQLASANGNLYWIGGFTFDVAGVVASNATSAVEVYAPATNTWTSATAMLTARGGGAVGVKGTDIYIAGGTNDGAAPLSTVELFHTATNTWSPAPSLPLPVSGAAGGFINANMVVVGGADAAETATSRAYSFAVGSAASPSQGGAAVTVNNLAPVVTSLSGNATSIGGINVGQQVSIQGSFTDAGLLDTHTVQINWGDGQTTTASLSDGAGQGSFSGTHSYAMGGQYSVSVTVGDQDQGSTTQSVDVFVTGASVVNRVLYVIGTAANDTISIVKQGKSSVSVVANFLPVVTAGKPGFVTFPLTAIDRVYVATGDGNDNAAISTKLTYAAMMFGGVGNDTLTGGGGPTILVGGDGNDLLKSGSKRDILIGGLGVDNLQGQSGDDILIGGATAYDTNGSALLSLMNEWQRTDLAATARVANLRNGTGKNGSIKLNSSAITNDGAIDSLNASSGSNWFWSDPQDLLVKKKKTDLVN